MANKIDLNLINNIMNRYLELYISYLDQLSEEISEYKTETDIWKMAGSIKNSPGNLAMHICGNLKHNFGAVFLRNEYKRNRDHEFSQKDTPKTVILSEIESTKSILKEAFEYLKPGDIVKPYLGDSYGEGQTIGSVIVRLSFHFAYHLGQINYHRRLICP